MEVSPNVLRKETVQTLSKVNEMLDTISTDEGLTPLKRAELVASLLGAKAQCLNTLTLLSNQAQSRKR